MKHADALIERILFLEGCPTCRTCTSSSATCRRRSRDLKLEQAAHPALKAAIAHCETVGDYVSRELFEDILESEEEHIDFLETQLALIGSVGRELPASQIGDGSPS